MFLSAGSLFTFGAGHSSSVTIEANISISINSTAPPDASSSSSAATSSTSTTIPATTNIPTVKSKQVMIHENLRSWLRCFPHAAVLLSTLCICNHMLTGSLFIVGPRQTNATVTDATISINATSSAANTSASSSSTNTSSSATKSLTGTTTINIHPVKSKFQYMSITSTWRCRGSLGSLSNHL